MGTKVGLSQLEIFMSNKLKLCVAAPFFVPLIAVAKSYPIDFAFCAVGSGCTSCIESVRMVATVDGSRKVVSLAGRSPDGGSVQEVLTECQVKSEADWRCEMARGVIQANAGKASFALAKPLVVDGRSFEACMRND